MAAPRVTADDLGLAATWLESYNDGEHTDYSGEEDQAAVVMFRVAAWLRAEEARRELDARVRHIARLVAQRTGRKPTDPRVLTAVRDSLTARRTA